MKPIKINNQQQFNVTGATIYYLLLLIMLGVFLGRISPTVRLPIFLRYDIYPHISNFVISYIFTSTILLLLVLQNARFKYMFVTVLVVIGLNVLAERFVAVAHTPDTTDALFGTCGAALALVITFIIKLFGLKKVDEK